MGPLSFSNPGKTEEVEIPATETQLSFSIDSTSPAAGTGTSMDYRVAPGETRPFENWFLSTFFRNPDWYSDVDPADRETLEAFYHATGGPDWNDNGGWLESDALNEWHGVETDPDGRVAELYLPANNLTGYIPAATGDLTAMTDLVLLSNNLTGPIPAELGQLVNLESLALGGNNLSGPIPVELARLRKLVFLGLDPDTGLCLPADFPESPFLDDARLDGVPDCGDGPAEPADQRDREALTGFYADAGGAGWRRDEGWLTDAPLNEWHGVEAGPDGAVGAVRLQNNGLTGGLPAGLADLPDLTDLNLLDNDLSGPAPEALAGLVNLRWMGLDDDTGICLPAGFPASAFADLAGRLGIGTCGSAEPPPEPVDPAPDYTWCATSLLSPGASCQRYVSLGGTGAPCESCPRTGEEALQVLEDEIDRVPMRIPRALCKLPFVPGCDDLPSIADDLQTAMWNAVHLNITQPLREHAPSLAGPARNEVLAGVTVTSSDPSVLEVVDHGGDTFTIVRHGAGQAALRIGGVSHGGATAAVSYRMDLMPAVPALPAAGLAVLAAALAAAGLRRLNGRRAA